MTDQPDTAACCCRCGHPIGNAPSGSPSGLDHDRYHQDCDRGRDQEIARLAREVVAMRQMLDHLRPDVGHDVRSETTGMTVAERGLLLATAHGWAAMHPDSPLYRDLIAAVEAEKAALPASKWAKNESGTPASTEAANGADNR